MKVFAATLLALGLAAAPAAAQPNVPFMIDCSASHTDDSRLLLSCANPGSLPGTVDLMYVCSTPLDFNRQIIFNEPGHFVAPKSTLRLTRDCGPEQVIITYQAWPLTQDQQDDEQTRLDRIRAERDELAGR
ncbi:hypothetical protein HLB23_13995 [Nocardia uniformis]|uniref:Secreted protein n=1 Tax=Nocardia uniformis TaxID=53432 RepID=A0A849C3E3_9NOCA|nr:hypothetical protein [Nocardia uniformis]NNH70960.1 hypothetical protein [Nocardia uniformis]